VGMWRTPEKCSLKSVITELALSIIYTGFTRPMCREMRFNSAPATKPPTCCVIQPHLGILAARRLVSCHSLPYPTRIPAAVKDSGNHDCILHDFIINGEWEPFGEESIMSENNPMNSAEVGERINIRVERVEKV